ncbi:AcrR family transcriptional regulator [Paenibacillus castaneae]|uniref:TetR/AcrR family transcriptional regulator n=1 Tax=Paenibacillus castaneae TaxID=474957 RepID=UPI000C9C034A|nr:TetR/AcrR family transcriptional regulator [Paenibacillus castaneae]NIK79447.1 AcrR family transcriptional regulator [Paenibacillus castaneae]
MRAGPTTAERIKLSALTMFTELGYEGASLSNIAKAVGIKTPSIYAHFESKEQLFLQLIEDVISEEREQYMALLQEIQQETIERQLYQLFDFFTNFNHLSTGQTFLKRTMLVPPYHLRDQLRKDIMAYELELTEGIVSVLRRGVSEGVFPVFHTDDEERLIAAFYVCADGLLVEYQIYDEVLYGRRKQMIWQSLWQLWTMTAREG